MWAARISLGVVMAGGVLFAQQRGAFPHPKTASEVQVPGDAAHGQAIFNGKGGCLACHQVGNKGSLLGVNLSDVATQQTVEQLRESLLNPSPQVQEANQLYRIVTRDGTTYTGKLLNQGLSTMQMLDSKGNLISLRRSDVRESGFIQTPPMPSYQGKLTPEEQTDLIAYLATLKGIIGE